MVPVDGRLRVAIVIPTHNRQDLLGRTLDSVAAVAVPPGVEAELLVVANACRDRTEQLVTERATGFPVPLRVVSEPTPGLNVARNRGVTDTTADWVAFLDDDVWVAPGWLSGFRAAAGSGADFVGGHVSLWWEAVARPAWLGRDMEWMLSNNEGGPDPRPIGPVGGLVGANFACRRAVFDAVGLFRPGLDRVGDRLLGGGESELIQRAVGAGFCGAYAPEMSVQHWVAPHRVTPAYLTGVTYGYGYSRVLMRSGWGPKAAARAIAGHVWLAGWHGLAGFGGRLLGRPGAIRHRCLAAHGRGGLTAAVHRLAGTALPPAPAG